MDLYILKYNNYFNRILKKEDSLASYLTNKVLHTDYEIQTGVSFNTNNDITTEQVVNYDVSSFDYLLAVEPGTEQEPTPIIKSRWFILVSQRTRTGQYLLQLKRDLIADNYNNVINAPVFIEKATILADSDVALYNKENYLFNEIKQDEILLKDYSETPWLIGYYAQNNQQVDAHVHPAYDNIEVYDNQASWPFNKYLTGGFHHVLSSNFTVVVQEGVAGEHSYIYHSDQKSSWYDHKLTGHRRYKGRFYQPTFAAAKQFAKVVYQRSSLLASTYLQYLESYDTKNELEKYIDNSIHFIQFNDTGNVYKIKVTKQSKKTEILTPSKNSAAATALSAIFDDFTYGNTRYISYDNGVSNVTAYFDTEVYNISLTLVSDTDRTFDFTLGAGKGKLRDAPYSMFAIPFNSINCTCKYEGNTVTFNTVNQNIVSQLASELALQLSDSIYDLQLVPYCPRPDLLDILGLDLSKATENTDYACITKTYGQTTSAVGIVLFPKESKFKFSILKPIAIDRQTTKVKTFVQFWTESKVIHWATAGENTMIGTFNIDDNIEIDELASIAGLPSDIEYTGEWSQVGNTVKVYAESSRTEYIGTGAVVGSIYRISTQYANSYNVDRKIDNDCTKYRLNSPNNAAAFDFNLNKNNGSVSYFNIDCLYKPYNPYIHVNPEFEPDSLYGNNFGDYRGLICQGDFSFPIINSEWKSYEINNKNYQNTFNREIEYTETMNAMAKINDITNAVSGTIQGGAQGAAAGSKAGPYGALAGAVIGTAAGAMGGAADVAVNDWARGQAVKLSMDRFNYNLQNIKARPYTLAKSSALDANNRLWPYIEKYSCTEQEKYMLRENLKYEGMTINRIDTIKQFLSDDYNYIRAKLIRATDINCDCQVLQAIAAELEQGLYMKE